MTQLGEGVAITNITEEKEVKQSKKKLKIRFSLFFDGTLNNRNNIGEREQFETGTTTKTYKNKGDGGNNSYDNGRTNIAIMEPHIEEVQDPYDFYFKLYIEGQGTFNTGDEKERGLLDGKSGDSTLGYAGGSGASGVYQRAKKGYQKAMMQLNKYLANYPPDKYEFEKIDIDVFGFSRGAATARYSISLMLEDEDKPVKDHLTGKHYTLVTEDSIQVKFAGLYDTVVSVNGSQYNHWSDNKLNQRAVALAKKSLHLAAAEEHRQDFPLHTITSAKKISTGKEYFLPGVHSDVGGSYNKANELLIDSLPKETPTTYKTVLDKGTINDMRKKREALLNPKDSLEKPKYLASELEVEENSDGVMGFFTKAKLIAIKQIEGKEYMRTSNEVDRIMNIGLRSKLEADKKNLITQGWYTEHEIEIADKKATTGTVGAVAGGLVAGPEGAVVGGALGANIGALIVNRANIKSAYSNIPLKIMADYTTKQAELKINNKLLDRADFILKADPFLMDVEKSINDYIAKIGNASKPENWLEDNSPWIKSIDMKTLRHDHLHMSAKMSIGYFPRFDDNQRRRYYYEG